jgi:hypothetical protein
VKIDLSKYEQYVPVRRRSEPVVKLTNEAITFNKVASALLAAANYVRVHFSRTDKTILLELLNVPESGDVPAGSVKISRSKAIVGIGVRGLHQRFTDVTCGEYSAGQLTEGARLFVLLTYKGPGPAPVKRGARKKELAELDEPASAGRPRGRRKNKLDEAIEEDLKKRQKCEHRGRCKKGLCACTCDRCMEGYL